MLRRVGWLGVVAAAGGDVRRLSAEARRGLAVAADVESALDGLAGGKCVGR